jgi:hypothetical protein
MLDWEISQSKTRIAVTVNCIFKEGWEEGLIHFLLNARGFLSYVLNDSLHKLPLLLQQPLQARVLGRLRELG